MRLWHEKLIPYLPRQQLLGQHRECCALRGNGWDKNHATVNYVFYHPIGWLAIYHMKVMQEMEHRGYKPNPEWWKVYYRGKECERLNFLNQPSLPTDCFFAKIRDTVYPEHNSEYLKECLENLKRKGVIIDMSEWKVQSNYIIGVGTMYIAYRIRDISKVVHSGNIEHYGKYSANREEVEELVKQLNSQEEAK